MTRDPIELFRHIIFSTWTLRSSEDSMTTLYRRSSSDMMMEVDGFSIQEGAEVRANEPLPNQEINNSGGFVHCTKDTTRLRQCLCGISGEPRAYRCGETEISGETANIINR